jgi:DNA-binding NarL/FixJ family response regulator
MNGIEATTEVLAALPDVAVVALTASADAAERAALVEAGAVTCLTKDQELDEIVTAIRHAAAAA